MNHFEAVKFQAVTLFCTLILTVSSQQTIVKLMKRQSAESSHCGHSMNRKQDAAQPGRSMKVQSYSEAVLKLEAFKGNFWTNLEMSFSSWYFRSG